MFALLHVLKTNLLDKETKYLQCASLQFETPKVSEILAPTNLQIFCIKAVGLLTFQYNIPQILKPGSQKYKANLKELRTAQGNVWDLWIFLPNTVVTDEIPRQSAAGALRNAPMCWKQNICWKDAAGSCRSWLRAALPAVVPLRVPSLPARCGFRPAPKASWQSQLVH